MALNLYCRSSPWPPGRTTSNRRPSRRPRGRTLGLSPPWLSSFPGRSLRAHPAYLLAPCCVSPLLLLLLLLCSMHQKKRSCLGGHRTANSKTLTYVTGVYHSTTQIHPKFKIQYKNGSATYYV